MKFKASVKNGRLLFLNESLCNEFLKKHEDKFVSVNITQYRNTRSLQQNKYLHGVVFYMIAEETGHSIEETKKKVKVHIGFFDEFEVKGEKFPELRETSVLDKKEFGEFVDQVRIWAMDFLNLNIPLPDEGEFDKLYFLHNTND